MVVLWGIAGLVLGVATGVVLRDSRPKPCQFCGYHDDQTQELYASEELDRMLEENE